MFTNCDDRYGLTSDWSSGSVVYRPCCVYDPNLGYAMQTVPAKVPGAGHYKLNVGKTEFSESEYAKVLYSEEPGGDYEFYPFSGHLYKMHTACP